jgi:hypothetical protein
MLPVAVRRVKSRGKKPTWSKAAPEIVRAIDAEIVPKILRYAENFVTGWDDKPGFRVVKKVTTRSIRVFLQVYGPHKKKWEWVSRGTGLYGPKHKKYKIRPKRQRRFAAGAPEGRGGQFRKRAKSLAFPSAYAPHTKPRGPSYGGPGKSSGDMVFAAEVNHPGIKPRHFEEAITRWVRQTKAWNEGIEKAIRRGLRYNG